MLRSKILYLRSLCANNVRSVLEVAIDELLVREVDQRTEENDGGGEEAETPEWKDLDQVVSEECSYSGL